MTFMNLFEQMQEEIDRLRGILRRVTPDPVWGEDPIKTAFYKEACAALQAKEEG